VYYEGFHIGQVEAIGPAFQGGATRFRVDIAVAKGWRIPDNSHARMLASGLLAAMSIDIQAGDSPRPLSPGDEIPGQEAANLFAVVSDVAGEITRISRGSLQPLLDNLNQLLGSIGAAVETNLPSILTKVAEASDKLLTAADAAERILRQETVEQLHQTAGDVALAAQNFRHLAENLERSRNDLDQALRRADQTITHSDQLVQETRPQVQTTLTEVHGVLELVSARMDSILYNLEGASRDLKEFARSVRNNPSRLLSDRRPDDKVEPR
jgi:phospholipid/cholesterol/gamma-HCH transport system substrate-binding protein